MVIDTSVLLALFFGEAHADWAVEQLEQNRGASLMSPVNLAETLILLRDRQPGRYQQLETQVLSGGIRFVAPDLEQARMAAEARLRYPLNLGDCFAYALARAEAVGIVTLDSDFRAVDVPLSIP